MEKFAYTQRQPLLGEEESAPVHWTLERRGHDSRHYQRSQSSRVHIWSWCAQIVVLCASLFTLWTGAELHRESSRRCVDKMSMTCMLTLLGHKTPFLMCAAPALSAVSDEYLTQRFHGTFRENSPYKGRPTESVSQAWDDLIFENAFSIDHDTLVEIGAPESSVLLPPELGGGYMAHLEVFHQLHCVQMLWTNTWPDLQSADAMNETSLYRMHIDHCADLLRQKLMCDGDVGVITYNWVKHLSHPTPNFNTVHKCRDFSAIRQWADEAAVPVPKDGKVHKPPNAVELADFP